MGKKATGSFWVRKDFSCNLTTPHTLEKKMDSMENF